jgi:hypothetical protein
MEPKALAKLNGMLGPTPVRSGNSSSTRDSQTVPNTPINRRDSSLWMRTPEDDGEDRDMQQVGELDWDAAMLTPLPKTPAPEAIARFAANVTPETPSTNSEFDAHSVLAQEDLITRTCPPKPYQHRDLGEAEMWRLMAARRKSLQFAPKVASPLSKAWD